MTPTCTTPLTRRFDLSTQCAIQATGVNPVHNQGVMAAVSLLGGLEGRHGQRNIDFREPALQVFFRSEQAEPDVMHDFTRILEDGIDQK